MHKKNVLFVAHHLTIGGVQKSLISALNYIDYKNNNVTLYLRKNRLDLFPYINENVKLIVNDDKHHYYRFPYAVCLQIIIKIKSLLKRDVSTLNCKLKQYLHDKQKNYEKKRFFENKNYDVAIAYSEGYPAEFVMDCVMAGRKIMFFQSSVDSEHTIHQRIMPQYDTIVVEHSDIKDTLTHWYQGVSNRIQILGNYTDYKLIKDLSKEKVLVNDNDTFSICTCSRFSPEKGLDLAIEAARILKEKGIIFKWYLVGDGTEKEKLCDLVQKYCLREKIIMTGMQKTPYPYMYSSDIYVQPSREEALSISMLESQMLCIPMVSTKTAGGIAMIQDGVNGLLADINAESLVETIEKLLYNKELVIEIRKRLKKIDYSQAEKRYRREWYELINRGVSCE